jgi:hypothetical protein
MPPTDIEWRVTCDPQSFEACRKDEKFAYIVALSRAVNALTFVRSVMSIPKDRNTAAARRDRLNSYLFGSALMYEVLKLVKVMNKSFQGDGIYQRGLHTLLGDPTARQIEQDHLKTARHGAVFHFDVDTFRETIEKEPLNECLFVSRQSKKRIDVHYSYSDIVAAEILVGHPAGNGEFSSVLQDAVTKTDRLVEDFTKQAEDLISYHLQQWGFRSSNSTEASPHSH